jgi:membrane-bound metal-dependent hydrolase YbcI (DUF457 family)
MITRHHIALSILFWLIPCTAFELGDPIILISILAGTVAGSILPDIHMKRPGNPRLLTAAWLLSATGRATIVPFMCLLYRLVLGVRTQPGDKRLTHSVPGIILFWVLCAGPLIVASILVENQFIRGVLLALSGGLFMGMIIHLVQDLCTRKGICPLYPFTDQIVYGSIRPCDVQDTRIPRFHIQLVSAFFLFHAAILFIVLPGSVTLLCGSLCAALCLVLMIWQSCVEIEGHASFSSFKKIGAESNLNAGIVLSEP